MLSPGQTRWYPVAMIGKLHLSYRDGQDHPRHITLNPGDWHENDQGVMWISGSGDPYLVMVPWGRVTGYELALPAAKAESVRAAWRTDFERTKER